VIRQTAIGLKHLQPTSPDDVRNVGYTIITFSSAMRQKEQALKEFLFTHLYRHPQVMSKMDIAAVIVQDLFMSYMSDSTALPKSWQQQTAAAQGANQESNARRVSDFIAGMTDQFALHEHERLFDRKSDLS
jgi:dGTPase